MCPSLKLGQSDSPFRTLELGSRETQCGSEYGLDCRPGYAGAAPFFYLDGEAEIAAREGDRERK